MFPVSRIGAALFESAVIVRVLPLIVVVPARVPPPVRFRSDPSAIGPLNVIAGVKFVPPLAGEKSNVAALPLRANALVS